MKKLFTIVFMMLVSVTSPAQIMKLGDLNHDNQVNITDVMTLVDIVLHGYSPFSVSPPEVTMQAGSTANVTIFGGYYIYEVDSANPEIVSASQNDLTITLTAITGGETTVTVKDVLTLRTIDIPVVVEYTSLQVSTNNLTLVANEQGTVEISSGSGYYSVVSCNEDVATAKVSGNSVTVTGVNAGSTTIIITDIKTDLTAEIEVTVEYAPIALSSPSLNLSIGDEDAVSITSGSGSYSVQSNDANVATATIDGNSVKVTAVGGGTATITVTDTQSGQTATIDVTVEFFPLTLSASSFELNIGDEESVSITSGNGNYSVQSSDTNVATATIDGNSVIVTAVGGGNATITVTDTNSGKTTDIAIKVEYFPLILAASSLKLNIDQETTVNIISGNGSFSLQSSNTGVATVKLMGFSVKINALSAGTSTITVTDIKSSQIATIEIIVSASYITCPDDNHPHMINLGLPSGTKWACCNVNTNNPENQKPTNIGSFYAWGETEVKDVYNENQYHNNNIGNEIAGTRYDVAYVQWGGEWQMPTIEQCEELMSNCDYEWITKDGVNGGRFTSKVNGASIFLPAAGYKSVRYVYGNGTDGYYWSSSQYPSLTGSAYMLHINSAGAETDNGVRFAGRPVRPVAK